MTLTEFQEIAPVQGAVLYVYLKSHILRIGRYNGLLPKPCNRGNTPSLCLSVEPHGKIVSWLALDYVRSVEVMAPAGEKQIEREEQP